MNQPYEFQEEEFDDYLDGGMDPEQRAGFEARLAADPALREAFDFHQTLRGNLHRRPGHMKDKADIARIRADMLKQAPPHRHFPNRIWGGVLLLLLMVAAGVCYFWPEPTPPPANPVPPPRPVIPRQDSLKPSGIMDTLKRPVVENKKGRTEKEISDLKMGSGESDVLIKEMPVTRLAVRGESVERIDGKKVFKLAVYKIAGGRPESHRTGERIRLYLLESQLSSPEKWRLIELVAGAQTNLYLQTGSDFYALKEGSQYLEKESDEAVLKWLRQ